MKIPTEPTSDCETSTTSAVLPISPGRKSAMRSFRVGRRSDIKKCNIKVSGAGRRGRGLGCGWWAGRVEVDRHRWLRRQPGKTADFCPQTSVVSSRFTRGCDASAAEFLAFFVSVVFLGGGGPALARERGATGVSVARQQGYRASFGVNERLLGIFIGGVILVRLPAWEIMGLGMLCERSFAN